MSLLQISGGANQLNYKFFGYVLFHVDYVDGLHNIHVIYILNYTKHVSDFLCIPNIRKRF